jgi:hypothetical protein
MRGHGLRLPATASSAQTARRARVAPWAVLAPRGSPVRRPFRLGLRADWRPLMEKPCCPKALMVGVAGFEPTTPSPPEMPQAS